MAHSKSLTWAQAERIVEQHCRNVLTTVALAENAYQDLLEAFSANGGTDQLFADSLFGDVTASADQVEQVTDMKNAMVSIHKLHDVLNNVSVTAADRVQDLYRMA